MKPDQSFLQARLEELLLDGRSRPLTERERGELNDMLRQSSAARAHAARCLLDDSGLIARLQESTVAEIYRGETTALASIGIPMPQGRRSSRARRAIIRLGTMAALIVFVVLGWMKYGERHAGVARFGTLHDCQWVAADEEPQTGQALRRGHRVELSAGTAEIVFDCGAVTTLYGPCIFEVESARSGFLILGDVRTRADSPDSKGFVLSTRLSRIVDLGTEFLTSVAVDGHSSVAVTDGEVAVHLPGGKSPQHLRLGDSLSLEPGRGRVMVRIERGDETPAFRFPSIEPPTDADFADARQGRARVSLGTGALRKAHRNNGASGPVERLLDGRGQSAKDMPDESVFFEDNTEGSLVLDLGAVVVVEKINTYSWHEHPRFEDIRFRAQQRYRLFGSDRDTPPSVEGDPDQAGWKFIARVNTDEYFGVRNAFERPAQQACSITSPGGSLGRYRYLLWVVEPILLPDKQFLNHTFYGEFDVFARP
jgi:hypothetical protein